ncbi:zinc-RING finger and ankyrin repeat domain-containing protein rolling pebbles isoform X1 [Musca autumnalis]|uniref:zinc-RING finger and ankyrin repeat domain-containing protein rolling pebbles isoform X1 n=1 Tax=Musca autumnalis TaxID=221902 RepID=UPI003CFB2157
MFSQHPNMPYNDLNTSFTSEFSDISYDSDSTFHIYNELNYPTPQQQQQPIYQAAATTNSQPINIQNNATPSTGIIYGFRTRHLSCIEENDSDSLHSSSIPKPAFEMIKDVDEKFKKLVHENPDNSFSSWTAPDQGEDEVDHIAMIDESRVFDLDYLDELSASQVVANKSQEEDDEEVDQDDQDEEEEEEEFGVNVSEALWQSTVSEPVHRTGFIGNRPPGIMPDIMTTSCYGALNTSFGSEMSGPPAYMETQSTPRKKPKSTTGTPTKQEPIYATPDKRRECNRSFDSSCPSQSSSVYGGSMNSSLDMRCMSASGIYVGNQQLIMPRQGHQHNGQNPMEMSGISLDGSKSEWNNSGGAIGENSCGVISPTEDMSEEMQVKCLNAAENDLQSIRRLLEHDTNSSVCPSCRISFDKGKRRKLIDTCGHERCYSCMFRNDQCPMCMNSSLKDVDCSSNAQGYDTGIGGSTSTIVSPLGSPQPQLRSQVQRANAAAIARYMQHNRQESISPEYHRYASIGKLTKAGASANSNNAPLNTKHTVTVDIHNSTGSSNNNNSNHHHTGTSSSISSTGSSSHHGQHHHHNGNSSNNNNNGNYSEIHASSFATPPTRRRFFNHKNLRNALTNGVSGVVGHRRTASNGGSGSSSGCPIDTSSILSEGSDHLGNEAEKQKDQLRARLGLLLDHDQNGNATNTTTSSSSSQNISPEQTLATGSSGLSVDHYGGSQLSVATKDDTYSLSGKMKACSLTDSNGYEILPLKPRKSVARRSARSAQLGANSKRNAIYKPAALQQQQQPPAIQLPLKPLFFEVPLQEPDPPFIGRQWLIRELANTLTATETPGVLINGNPGTGKTAFILQLVEYSCFGRRNAAATAVDNDPDGIYYQISSVTDRLRSLASYVVGYHFCQADANLTCLVPDFVHSLAAQLCQAPQLAAYREYLLNETHLQDILSVKECIADAERVMRMAILEPLTILKRAGKIPAKTCIILVDALCEAEYHRPDHGHTIATFLAKMTQYFPSWLKVVATVRTQMLEFVKGLSYTKMTLDSWASNDLLQKDMLDYITFRVNNSNEIQKNVAVVKDHNTGQLKFIGHLQSLTKGSMLYAKLILDLIEKGQLVIKSTSYKVLPISLAQIFLLHFNLRFPTSCSFEKAAPILNVCLAALYPLTLNEIYYTVCAMKTDEVMPWDEFMQRFKLLDGFLIKRIDNTYMFFHSSFREWLIRRDEGESPKFLCDFRLGHAAIAFRLSRLQAPLDPEQTMELGHHMLKAHIYRNNQGPQSPRDMQSYWVSTVSDNVSAALGSLRNVYSPNLKVSRLILLAGASPHYRTEFMGDATILCIAAYEGIVPMVSLLLEFGADVGLTNSQGCTPLILAAMRGHCDVVRLLVAAGSSLGQCDTTQRCALVQAARMGRLNVVKYLLACDWTPRPNSTDVSLPTAIHQSLIAAASQDHITILEDLVDMEDIDVNAIEPCSGELALTSAARNGCLNTVEVLLTRGANIDLHNKQGFTALGLSVKEGHWAVAEKLLQSGADLDEPVTSARKTALMIAAEEGHLEILEMLIERGANLETQDHEGFTALSWACLRGRQTAAKILIDKGCNKNHADNNGRTGLDLAAYQGSAHLVQYLMDQGANIEHVDVNGMRPLDRAIACRNIQVVQVFLRKGAKLGPTTWSMAMGKPEILVVLLNKLLEDGNVLYRKNRFHEAAHRYQYALRKISNLETLLERSAIFAQLRTNLLLNLSRCKRKLNELDESIDLASQAITQKPTSYEGYYARAKARMEHGDINEALADANEAMQKAAQSGVLNEVIEVLKRIQAELLQRITNEGRNQQTSSSTSSGYEVSGGSSGITTMTTTALIEAGGAGAGGGAFESQHEITDL